MNIENYAEELNSTTSWSANFASWMNEMISRMRAGVRKSNGSEQVAMMSSKSKPYKNQRAGIRTCCAGDPSASSESWRNWGAPATP